MSDVGQDTVQEQLPALLPRLWRFAYVLSRSRDTAEDLVQAACLRALERRDQFRLGSRFDAWMFTIVSSIWKNQLRAEKVRRGEGQVAAEDVLSVDGVRAMDTNILLRQVLERVMALPDAQRVVALLVYGDGLSYKEAAAVLDIPIGTVMSRLAAARQSLARATQDAADRQNEGEP